MRKLICRARRTKRLRRRNQKSASSNPVQALCLITATSQNHRLSQPVKSHGMNHGIHDLRALDYLPAAKKSASAIVTPYVNASPAVIVDAKVATVWTC